VVWEQDVGGGKEEYIIADQQMMDLHGKNVISFDGYEAQGYDATPIVIGHFVALVVWRYGQQGAGGLYAWAEPAVPD